MITKQELRPRRSEALRLFRKAKIHLSGKERRSIEVADFGRHAFADTSLGVLVCVNTDRRCAKDLALWSGQMRPQHRHPPVGTDPGKEEIVCCRRDRVHRFIEGTRTRRPGARSPRAPRRACTVGREIVLEAGDPFTVRPGMRHGLQAGPRGAVVSAFSTRSTDENDLLDDLRILRITPVA